MTTEARAGSRFLALLQWALVALVFGYAALIYYGVGPTLKDGSAWWDPTGFLWGGWLTPVLESTPRAMLVLPLPAVLITVGVFLAGHSGIARGLALSGIYATLLFTFYGVQATFPWEFFHWRGSAVMIVMSLFLGFATAAPFLARSWLTLGWPLRLAIYLPIGLVVLGFIRNATGTDESLSFSISPWPAVSVFGMEVGALFIFTGLLGVAVAVRGIATARASGGGAPRVLVSVALGLAIPVALLALGSALSLLPFKLGPRVSVAVAVTCSVLIGAALLLRPRDAEGLRIRARQVGVGAALIGIPLFAGQAWAFLDYYVTREHLARDIIDGLQAYYEREEIYPDEMEDLVTTGDIASIPEPSIGFGFLYDGHFRYRSFGTSFILEFPAPRWVECAYTPPYEDDDEDFYEEDEEDVAAGPDGDGDENTLEEAWSCPDRPPELW